MKEKQCCAILGGQRYATQTVQCSAAQTGHCCATQARQCSVPHECCTVEAEKFGTTPAE